LSFHWLSEKGTGPSVPLSNSLSMIQHKLPRVDQRPHRVLDGGAPVCHDAAIVSEVLAILGRRQPAQGRQEQIFEDRLVLLIRFDKLSEPARVFSELA